jgi:hypothetical protein
VTRPVTVILPSLDDVDLFERNLPALLEELEGRSLADEVLVVDDTGRDVLAGALRERFPTVRVLARPRTVASRARFEPESRPRSTSSCSR